MKHSESVSTLQTPGSTAGDLASGRAFDNGCRCMLSSEALLNDLTGRQTVCQCNVSTLNFLQFRMLWSSICLFMFGQTV